MIYMLDLPKPSKDLIDIAIHYAKKTEINMDTLRWHQSLQNESVNCAYGNFFINPEISELAIKEFQPFFKKPIKPIIGAIINTARDKPASYTPHTDRVRSIGINYYVESGGDNVQTVFYTKFRELNDPGGKVLPYEGLTIDCQYKFSTDTWYAMNSTQYHSVENIETIRYIIGLSLHDTEFSELINLVPNTKVELG
jgi:hypothetical protein